VSAVPDSPSAAAADAPASVLADALAAWRRELAATGGDDPLTRYRDLPDGTLDLGSAHPSGLAGFLAGRPTRLSSLFREPGRLSDARRRARAIRLAAMALAEEHGLRAGHLAIGMVSWRRHVDPGSATEVVTAPVLLRPLTLRPRGAGHVDYDLDLGLPVRVNPALVRLLQASGVRLHPGELEALAAGEHGFDPAPAYERLAELAGRLPELAVRPRLVVSTFVDLAPALVAELDRLAPTLPEHDVVAALVGDAAARERLAGPAAPPLAPARPGGPRAEELQVLSLDADQRAVLDAVLAGRSVRVEAPAGTGATQVVAAVLAALAAGGRHALLVAAQRGELRDVATRLAAAGLPDVVQGAPDVSPPAPAEPPAADLPVPTRPADAVERLRRQHDALHAVRQPWGASALTAMHELARLTSALDPPRTAVRLPAPTLRRLDPAAREEAAAALAEAAELGAFDPGATQAPWFGAELADEADASTVLAAASALATELLPRLRTDMARLAADAGLSGASTVAEWGRQLDLLVGVRATLDVFTPAVYERPVADMVAATAPAAWRAEHGVAMGMWERRRWERHARELVRPGSYPADLHAALVAAQAQRTAWQSMSTGGGWPRVPAGLAAADAAYSAVVTELRRLETVLAGTPEGGRLLDAPLPDLERRLDRLAGDPEAVASLPRRTAALATLRRLGLDPLVEDLRARACAPHQVRAELELAWWRSLLELLLAEDRDLAAAGDGAHDDALESLRAAERSARADVVRRTRDALAVSGTPPVRATSPLALPQEVPPHVPVDVVVVAGAHRVGAAEGVLALGRARQVVVVGDPCGLPPATVALADDTAAAPPVDEAAARQGLLQLLDGALPTLRLGRQHRMPAQVARVADAVPPPSGERPEQQRVAGPPDGSYVSLVRVADGAGHPSPDGGVESVDAEVHRVVELVVQHARTRPEESLAVVALNRLHARRIADALRADLPEQPDVARWLASGASEPFVVTDADRAEDAVRDAVVVAVGFARTPHGRVLHRFGRLDADAGDARVAVALTRARRRLTVVSSLAADDLDPERLRTPGARALAAVLRHLEDAGPATVPPSGDAPDPLLDDLTRRLEVRGRLAVAPATRAPADGPDLVLPPAGGAEPVAVLTDLRPAPDETALLERDLLLPEQLARYGWRVVRIGAVGLFTDPDAQVRRVAGRAR
jgi:hypothetical protein